jgi:hypothetical protein
MTYPKMEPISFEQGLANSYDRPWSPMSAPAVSVDRLSQWRKRWLKLPTVPLGARSSSHRAHPFRMRLRDMEWSVNLRLAVGATAPSDGSTLFLIFSATWSKVSFSFFEMRWMNCNLSRYAMQKMPLIDPSRSERCLCSQYFRATGVLNF